jgi:putative transposase
MYTPPTVAAAEARFVDFSDTWGEKYPAMIRSWQTSWAEFVPFLEVDDSWRITSAAINEQDRAGEET